jgi:hypothetical protein
MLFVFPALTVNKQKEKMEMYKIQGKNNFTILEIYWTGEEK